MVVPYSLPNNLGGLHSRCCTHSTRYTTMAHVARVNAINIETEEEGSWKSLFSDGGCTANKCFFLVVGIQFMLQTSGQISYLSGCFNPH
jgi:hypothetical protein